MSTCVPNEHKYAECLVIAVNIDYLTVCQWYVVVYQYSGEAGISGTA